MFKTSLFKGVIFQTLRRLYIYKDSLHKGQYLQNRRGEKALSCNKELIYLSSNN